MENLGKHRPQRVSQRGMVRLVGLGLGGLLAALLLGLMVLPSEASASHGKYWMPPLDSGNGPGDGMSSPPKAPPKSGDCIQDYLKNSERCKSIWCEQLSFFFFNWTSCDDSNLSMCMENVQSTYDCCLNPANCGGG